MNFISFFNKTWNKITGLVSTLIVYFLGIVYFPEFKNDNLSELNVDFHRFTFILMITISIVFIVWTHSYNKRSKAKIFLLLGALFLTGFLAVLFWVYYPYLNKYSVFVRKDCHALFLVGDVRSTKFHGPEIGSDLESAIAGADCDPSNVWTGISIQNIFNALLYRYILCIGFFSLALLNLIQSLYCISKENR